MKVGVAVLGSPVPNRPYGLCGRKATLNLNKETCFRWWRGRRDDVEDKTLTFNRSKACTLLTLRGFLSFLMQPCVDCFGWPAALFFFGSWY